MLIMSIPLHHASFTVFKMLSFLWMLKLSRMRKQWWLQPDPWFQQLLMVDWLNLRKKEESTAMTSNNPTTLFVLTIVLFDCLTASSSFKVFLVFAATILEWRSEGRWAICGDRSLWIWFNSISSAMLHMKPSMNWVRLDASNSLMFVLFLSFFLSPS